MAGNGGARPGAGRPRKKDKYAGSIAKAEERIVDKLPALIDNMFVLADGGYERVEEQWAPAGSLWVGSGEFQRRMYPDLKDDVLVLVRRTVSIADRDRAANEYLINRILGKPVDRHEINNQTLIQFRWGATIAEVAEGSDDDPTTPS